MWRRTVQLAAWLAFAGVAWLTTATAGYALPPATEAIFVLDPLVGLAALVAGTAGLIVVAGLVASLALTLVAGRFFCNWLCPLGATLDATRLAARPLARLLRLPQPLGNLPGGTLALIAVLVALPFGLSLVGFTEPLAIMFRALAATVLPDAGLAADSVRFVGGAPIRIHAATHPWAWAGALWLGLILGLELLQTRAWCRNLCPSGALFAWLDRLRVRWRGRAPQPGAGPTRRDVLVAGLAGAALPLLPHGTPPHRLRPPGADADDHAFLVACVRCGACVRACPTQALQPMLLADGLAGVFAPRLVPRQGACEFTCRACAKSCPTGAIPLLDLATKQRQVMGTAVHDHARCLPWAGGGECRVCHEHCPVAEKAIVLTWGRAPNGQALPLPSVATERCIGCGTCEFVCPIEGDAGVRVFHRDQAEAARKRMQP
jgi:MauM/NapG family ferredoxin protein